MRRFGEGSRRVLLPLAFLAVLGMGASSAFAPRLASGQGNIGDQITGLSQTQNPVEQQTPGFAGPCASPQLPGWCQPDQSLWVVNPTGCIWDHDDFARFGTEGVLGGNVSYSLGQCFIADWDTHFEGLGHVIKGGVTAAVGTLVFTACTVPGTCLPVTVTQTGPKAWLYQFCTSIYYPQGDPALQSIPGSNGGLGVPTDLTMTVRNPTTHKVAGVALSYAVGDDLNPMSCS